MKNRSLGNNVLSALALFAVCVVFAAACKAAADVEYKKYNSDADVPRMSVEDAKKEVDAGNAIIVDSRAEAAYKAEHIKGSINIAAASDEAFSKLPKGKKIIVYCS